MPWLCSVSVHALTHRVLLQKGTVQFLRQTNKHCETTYSKASSGMYCKICRAAIQLHIQGYTCKLITVVSRRAELHILFKSNWENA